MPLTQTRMLIETFGKSLTDGSISNEHLLQLLKTPFGESQTWFDIKKPISDTNHNSIHASYDFVQTICETLKPEILHALIQRILSLTKDADNCDFTQTHRSNVTLVFLAYEMLHNPKLAEELLTNSCIPKRFPTPHAIKKFKDQDMQAIMTELQIIELFPKLPRNEGAYELAFRDLEFKKLTEVQPLRGYIQAIISAVQSLSPHGVPPYRAVHLMLKTSCFLDGRISAQEYRLFAQEMPEIVPLPPSRSIISDIVLESVAALSGSLTRACVAKGLSFFGVNC